MLRRIIRSILAVLGVLLLLLVVFYGWYVLGVGVRPRIVEAPGLRWEVKASLPQARTEVSAALWRDRIIVIGGIDWFAHTTATVQIYDPRTDAWTVGPALPHPVDHAVTASVGERVYLMGGWAGVRIRVGQARRGLGRITALGVPTARAFVFDGTWREVAALPEPLGGSGIAVLDGRIHVISGGTKTGNSPAHYAYDPVRGRWERRADLPAARDHLAAAVLAGRLYAIGGRRGGNFVRNLARVDVYNPRTNAWAPGPSLLTRRSGHGAAAVGGRIFVFGGEAPRGTIAPVEAFDGTRWVTVSRMPTPRHGLGVAVVGQTVYLLSGGKRPFFSISDTNELLTVLGSAP